jgi:hypothetical protein
MTQFPGSSAHSKRDWQTISRGLSILFVKANGDKPMQPAPYFVFVLCTLMCIVLEGCCSRPLPAGFSEVAEFERKHPSEYKEFLYLNPVNLDTYRCMVGLQLAVASGFSREVKLRFGTIQGINEFAEKRMSQEAAECQITSRHYAELEALCLPRGAICQFAWMNDERKEIGLLVIKEGNIAKRDVWIVDYLKEKTNSQKEIGN